MLLVMLLEAKPEKFFARLISRSNIAIALIALFAGVLRFWRLAEPETLVFDEVYYVDGARDLLQYGVEIEGDKGEFVVHPPLGKWLIALSVFIFRDTSFSWRFSSALVGVASVLLIYLIAKELFPSRFIAIGAAFLLAIDGLAIVMSRTALLDNFLTFFILLSFYFLLKNKLILMGVSLGLAIAVKWSGGYYLVFFLGYLLITFISRRDWKNLTKTFAAALLSFFIYLLSWVGWFMSKLSWSKESDPNSLIALWNYHKEIYTFHSSLSVKHPYQSDPFSWLVMGRPTSFFYESEATCGETECAQEILALGNPILWWLGTIALFSLIGYWISRKDRVSGLILLGFSAGYIPWFAFPERTMFTFYAISILPFLILALGYLGNELLINRAGAKGYLIAVITLIFLLFLYFFPVYVGESITYDQWRQRMWLESWI
jgi:dolichyl-phosphate-mannose--protein O-mannosyl transferase